MAGKTGRDADQFISRALNEKRKALGSRFRGNDEVEKDQTEPSPFSPEGSHSHDVRVISRIASDSQSATANPP